MKKIKKIGLAILITLAVLIYGFPLVTLLAGKAFDVPVHQPVENIQSIELLDTSRDRTAVLKVLSKGETETFLNDFLSLKAGRYVNDPPTRYGILTVKIYYQDGAVDFIGSDMNAYFLASGEEKGAGWYYLGREEMIELFENYVDRSILPDADMRLD